MSFILSTLLRATSDRQAPARALWVRPALAVALLLSAPLAQAACDPSVSCCAGAPAAGSPCGGAGVATLGNTSGVDSGAGNPLNVLGGNKFQREVDMPALPGVLGLELVRYYNSADSERHLLGRGWRLSYETTLRVGTGALAGTLEVVQADGTRIAFALPPDERQDPGQGQGDLYRGLSPLHGLVHRLHTPRGSEYLWRWADGRQLRFNTTGQLEQVRVPSGEFLSLRYDGRGWLSEVIDPAGRRLRLHVLDKAGARRGDRYRGVQSIDTPVGRFVYEHGARRPEGSSARPSEPIANLTRVIFPGPGPSEGATPPSTLARRYHYEDPRFATLLTGISAQRLSRHGQARSERLNTWAYDEERRAVLSFKGERPSGASGASGASGGVGQEQVRLQHGPSRGGQRTTVLTNSLGQTTVYSSTTIAGEPRLLQAIGPGCASCTPGNRRYGYDRVGRLIEETTLDEKGRPLRSTRTERDAYGRPVEVSTITYRNGQAQAPQLRVRYEYAPVDASDPQALPSLRPVLIAVPSVIAGRERITRIAYNAAMQPVEVTEEGFSPVDEQGQFNPQGVAIRRTTTYGYTQINGRSVLASVDGPLPNGPNANPEDSDITRYGWDARADHLQRIVRPGPRTLHVHREPESGRIVGVTGPDGVTVPLPQATRGNAGLSDNADLNGNAGPSGKADLLIEHDPWARPVAWRTVAGAASGTASGDDSEALLSATWGPAGSYGRTQFVVETFLRTLTTVAKDLNAQQRHQLRLDQPVRLPNGAMGTMLDMVGIANGRAAVAARSFSKVRMDFGTGLSFQQAQHIWESLTTRQQTQFQHDTGLNQREYVDMLGFTPEGRARTEAEGKNAFASEAVIRMVDGDGQTSFGTWLMWLYSSQDEYNFVSKMSLKNNLSKIVEAPSLAGQFLNTEAPGTDEHMIRQRTVEDDLAQRVAAMHNWGNVRRITAPAMDLPSWVKNYADEFSRSVGRGDWRSLRCGDELKNTAGLRMQPLNLK